VQAGQYAEAVFKHVKATEEMIGSLQSTDIDGTPGSAPIRNGDDGENATEPKGKEKENVQDEGGLGDDLRLMRVRTRQRELVVVPGEFAGEKSDLHRRQQNMRVTRSNFGSSDSKFILVVFHDTPRAQ
jgi:hypothetical protein